MKGDAYKTQNANKKPILEYLLKKDFSNSTSFKEEDDFKASSKPKKNQPLITTPISSFNNKNTNNIHTSSANPLLNNFQLEENNNEENYASKQNSKDALSALINYFHPDRVRSERERLFISFLSNLFYALANLMIKFISKFFPTADASTTSLYRFLVMFLLSYLYIVNRKIKFVELTQVLAMLMITNSEIKSDQDNPNLDIGLGCLWGTSSLVATVVMIISTKMLMNEIDSINLNYFIGKFSTFIGVGICLVNRSIFYLYPGYVLLTTLNGLFFWCALYFMNISLKINNLIATSCIGFLSLVYAYGFGLFFFGEKLGSVDVLASFIIFGFNIYSILYPDPQETSNANANTSKSSSNQISNGDNNNNNNRNDIEKNTDNKIKKSSV